LDIYGELMDSVYLYNKHGNPISYELWTHLRRLVNWVCDNWQREDEGIWEIRGGRRHFVYSKLMCWVALDRGLRLADKRSFPADRDRWLKARDQIYEEIMAKGWSATRRAFVQHYGAESLDAANLMMPLVFFVSPTDPRMIMTLDATMRSPEKGGLLSTSLVYRYNREETVDGLQGSEGTFNICTFWLVEALTRAGRVNPIRLDEARLMFEQMLGYANHLGLYAEETGPRGESLGNFPQAFTHLGLISAAFNLDKALGRRA
jgi:GH15 family glucan-1,4-alpha-glucosidase